MHPPVDPAVREGEVLAGRYRIGALIGAGGYGRVYKAVQLPLGREIAIKIVLADDRDLVARFAREAAIAQRLEHPNTVRVLDAGVTADGLPFLALELLRGSSVHDLLNAHGPLDIDTALEVTAQVLKSLAEAHEKGIVHRDIKPENVFVTSHFGEPVFVKVLDFGIAKEMKSTGQQLTVNGEAVGTPNYMPPEQVMGMPTDGRTDLYAVGLLLAEMVTGNTVFEGGQHTLLRAQLGASPVPLEESVRGSAVGPIVERAVQRRPTERYQSAGDMLSAVEVLLGDRRARSRAQAAPPHPLPAAASPPTGTPTASDVVVTRPVLQSLPPRPRPPGPGFAGPSLAEPGFAAPTVPLQRGRAPASKLLVALIVVGAVIGALATLAVIIVVSSNGVQSRSETTSTDEQPTTKLRHDAPVPSSVRQQLDPRVKPLKTVSLDEIRRALRGGGYSITVDDLQGTNEFAHTFVAQQLPCVGTVIRMALDDPETMHRTVDANLADGAIVLVDGSTMVSVTIHTGKQWRDPECTRDVARLLQR